MREYGQETATVYIECDSVNDDAMGFSVTISWDPELELYRSPIGMQGANIITEGVNGNTMLIYGFSASSVISGEAAEIIFKLPENYQDGDLWNIDIDVKTYGVNSSYDIYRSYNGSIKVDIPNSDKPICYEKIDKNKDGVYDYVIITDCYESAVSVEIPSEIDGLPVTTIERYAFAYCESLESVVIPDSVISIEKGAFKGCTSITSISIPDSVTSIGEGAFKGCTSITSISIPDSVTTIESYAFSGCKNLKSIIILNPDCDIFYKQTIANGFDDNNEAYFNGTVCGYEDSTAQSYAEKYGYNFVAIDDKKISSRDIDVIIQYLSGNVPVVIGKYDINGDGVINVFDMILLKRQIMNK